MIINKTKQSEDKPVSMSSCGVYTTITYKGYLYTLKNNVLVSKTKLKGV